MAQAKRSECVTEAVSALLIQEPFFASLLLDLMEIVEADSTPMGILYGSTPQSSASSPSKNDRAS